MALSETIAFSRAVDVADTVTDPEDTLVVVTSDHSHTMTINGYPSRIDKIVERVEGGDESYSSLSYTNARLPNFTITRNSRPSTISERLISMHHADDIIYTMYIICIVLNALYLILIMYMFFFGHSAYSNYE